MNLQTEEENGPPQQNYTNIVFIFRYGQTRWDKTVAKATRGVFAHVDINIHDPDMPRKTLFAYSSYMYNPLIYGDMTENQYDCEHDVAISLKVTEDEAKKATQYLDELVEKKTLYNYKDISLCLLPRYLHGMIVDVQPDNVQKVFCSQLAVLVLRKCLSLNAANIELLHTLSELNSRCTSPNFLYYCLKPFGTRVEIGKLCIGQIQIYNDSNTKI